MIDMSIAREKLYVPTYNATRAIIAIEIVTCR